MLSHYRLKPPMHSVRYLLGVGLDRIPVVVLLVMMVISVGPAFCLAWLYLRLYPFYAFD